jgi:hypothetical protein
VLQLVQPEKSALADMAKACCGGKYNDTSKPTVVLHARRATQQSALPYSG